MKQRITRITSLIGTDGTEYVIARRGGWYLVVTIDIEAPVAPAFALYGDALAYATRLAAN